MSELLFPPEILELIFQNLDRDDLLCVSLTCRSFLTVARALTWNTMALNLKVYLLFMQLQKNSEFDTSFLSLVQNLILRPFKPPSELLNNISSASNHTLQIQDATDIEFAHFRYYVLDIFPHHLNNLVSLDISLDQNYLNDQPYISSNSVFPNLRKLFIRGVEKDTHDYVPFPFRNNPLEIHFPHLHQLGLTRIYIENSTLVTLLRKLTSLTKLELLVKDASLRESAIHFSDVSEKQPLLPNTLFLPHLQNLHVNYSTFALLSAAFSSSSSSSLPLLNLDISNDVDFANHRPISFPHLFKQLTTLSMRNFTLSFLELHNLLHFRPLKFVAMVDITILNVPSSFPSIHLPELRRFDYFGFCDRQQNMEWNFLNCPKLSNVSLSYVTLQSALWPTIKELSLFNCQYHADFLPTTLVNFFDICNIVHGRKLLPHLKFFRCALSNSSFSILDPLCGHTPLCLSKLGIFNTGVHLKHLFFFFLLPDLDLEYDHECVVILSDAVLTVSEESIWIWKAISELRFVREDSITATCIKVEVIEKLSDTDLHHVVKGLKAIPMQSFSICGPFANDFLKTLETSFDLQCGFFHGSQGQYYFKS